MIECKYINVILADSKGTHMLMHADFAEFKTFIFLLGNLSQIIYYIVLKRLKD